jgi:molecular chaperone HscB
MKLDSDDFEVFGLPRRYALGIADLEARWKALQSEVHPDRYAADGAAAQRVAMQWAVRVNEGYRRLRDPLQRALVLCELLGAKVDVHDNTAMPAAFLMQQMAWREALDEAGDAAAVQRIDEETAETERALHDELRVLLDERGDAHTAAQRVRALMFVKRFREDIDHRLEALGQ